VAATVTKVPESPPGLREAADIVVASPNEVRSLLTLL
jgi:hypothetical protein